MKHFNHKIYGSGEPVIILHGLLGMLDNWHSFAKNLSDNYKVISLDQRNHGKSFHSDSFDYELLADDLNDFLLEMNLEKCKLIGHSMGGKTVMQFLNKYPEKAEKSVVVDISPKSFGGGHEEIFKALLSLDLTILENRKAAQEHMVSHLGNNMGVVFFLLKNLGRTDKGFEWKANIKSLWDNYANITAAINFKAPISNDVLFIKGEQSNYIKAEDEQDIKKLFSSVVIKSIADAGHWVHADAPQMLLEEIRNFFKD